MEAVAYLGTQRSFRGAPKEAMVRTGCERAVLRAELTRQGVPVLVEAEVASSGRSRAQVNRQPARARRDLAEAVPVTVFSPDDLGVVRAGPSRRRDLLDDALGLLDPAASALADEVERVLRQRGALLRQAGGRASAEVATTLDVWDERLATAGTALAAARDSLVEELAPFVAASYASLAAGAVTEVGSTSPTAGRGRARWPTPWPRGAARTCGAAPPAWDRTATTWPWPSTGATPGCRPPRASSAAWPWLCGWGSTSW